MVDIGSVPKEKLSNRIQVLRMEVFHKDAFDEFLEEIVSLEAEREALDKTVDNLMVVNGEALAKITRLECGLAEANALCIKLAHQKGGQVDEIRALKNCYRAASEWCDDVEKLERTANPINILLPVKKLTELEASLRGGG